MHRRLVGQNCPGRPRIVWNDAVLSDIHKLVFRLIHPWCSEQACLEGTDLRRMYLMPAGQVYVFIIISINV